MLLFVFSLCCLGLVSAFSPRLRLVGPRTPGAGCPWLRFRHLSSGRLRVFRPAMPQDCPPLKVFNVITKNPPPKPAPAADGPPKSAPAAQNSSAVKPNPDARSRRAGGFQFRFLLQLLLDTSESERAYQDVINAGVRGVVTALGSDPLVGNSVEIQVIAFHSRVASTPFVPLADYVHAPLMPVGGGTCLGLALGSALDSLKARLAELRTLGVPVNQRLMVVLTDGHTFDSLQVVPERVRPAEKDELLHVLPVGVGDVNVAVMESLSSRHKPIYLRSEGGAPDYDGLFRWLKKVIRVYTASGPGTNPDLPPADDIRR